ncbi:MAG: hypothetical protein K5945_00535 [Bacteroidaceae bacterium]|nr:hypothetical protein [Bacteroidaceae bacterium]
MQLSVLNQNGTMMGEPLSSKGIEISGQLDADKLGQYLSRLSARIQDAKKVTADGKFENTTISWGSNAR